MSNHSDLIEAILPEVVDGYFRVLTDHFILVIDVRRGEVDHYIHNKHYINCKNVQLIP